MTDTITPDIPDEEFFAALREIQVETRCLANACKQWDVTVPVHLTGEDLNQYLARHLPNAESDSDWSYTGEHSDDRSPQRMLSLLDGQALVFEDADAARATGLPARTQHPQRRAVLRRPGPRRQPRGRCDSGRRIPAVALRHRLPRPRRRRDRRLTRPTVYKESVP
ncbi:hypothetical protein [Catenulispora rubra]|uniref:hypothetical protein n=1 Tax=Catenulispora rubra TaxID=280293 RepID=UPI00189286E6|nr:hypothetical protein [Catenulispora rubra]